MNNDRFSPYEDYYTDNAGNQPKRVHSFNYFDDPPHILAMKHTIKGCCKDQKQKNYIKYPFFLTLHTSSFPISLPYAWSIFTVSLPCLCQYLFQYITTFEKNVKSDINITLIIFNVVLQSVFNSLFTFHRLYDNTTEKTLQKSVFFIIPSWRHLSIVFK